MKKHQGQAHCCEKVAWRHRSKPLQCCPPALTIGPPSLFPRASRIREELTQPGLL